MLRTAQFAQDTFHGAGTPAAGHFHLEFVHLRKAGKSRRWKIEGLNTTIDFVVFSRSGTHWHSAAAAAVTSGVGRVLVHLR